jgi:cytochrome P450
MMDVFQVLNDLIADRVAQQRDDLMSRIIAKPIDDRPLTHDELQSIAFLLFLAGLDTVIAALSFSYWHLAQTPSDRRAVADGTVPSTHVVEEMLRQHSFVNLPRIVANDMEFAGVQLRKGDPVVLATALASRDPEEHEDATGVHIDRKSVRHYAFGAGPHRCLGSHLARLEMRVMLEEWHRRIPDYRVDGEIPAYGGTVMGVSSLPLRWA